MEFKNDPFGNLSDDEYESILKEIKTITIQKEIKQTIDICKNCNNLLYLTLNNIKNICNNCGVISEETIDVSLNNNEITNNKIRIVGYNSNHFQPDLYRSDNSNVLLAQKKQIFNEYKYYRQKHIELGERAFPINACEIAAEYYNKIQQQCVKRSQNKKSIMAACLWQACLSINFAPSKIEIARFMQLSHKGIAKGNNFIRTLVSNKQLDIDPNINPIYPEIYTLFLQLSYIDEKYKIFHKIIFEVIELANKNSIGINSLLKTKVIGTTYIVLKRCRDKSLIKNPPLNTKEFCKDKIRKNTIDKFINEINSYNSYFKELYISYNLYSELL